TLAYTIYIIVRCMINPDLGPPISKEDRKREIERTGVPQLLLALFPPLLIIMAVLGSIFFGVATPTEAAAVGVIASLILGLSYRSLTMEKLAGALKDTLTTTSMILTMTAGAVMFISSFA